RPTAADLKKPTTSGAPSGPHGGGSFQSCRPVTT
ncbi:uncharacterized protein METZ01_LOCUS218084, partial [marine metagenome]